MHLEWYLWIALGIVLLRTPFCFINAQRAADDPFATAKREALELIITVAALVAVLAHGTGSW